MTASDRRVERVAHYSILRYVPDPIRDEPINVGLAMVSDGWAKIEAKVPKSRLSAIGRRSDAEVIERWAKNIAEHFDARGVEGWLHSDVGLSAEWLHRWAADFGGTVRFGEPQVAIHFDLNELWTLLYRRFVGRQVHERKLTHALVGEAEFLVAGGEPALTAAEERVVVIDAVIGELKTWETFDRSRLVVRRPFQGRQASHIADLAIMNGHVTAVAQALPLEYGSHEEVITSRALLLDAALDLAPEVLKVGVYRDPPSARADLLAETFQVVEEARAKDIDIILRSTSTFGDLESRFGLLLFG